LTDAAFDREADPLGVLATTIGGVLDQAEGASAGGRHGYTGKHREPTSEHSPPLAG
jgi:hypothetical protein